MKTSRFFSLVATFAIAAGALFVNTTVSAQEGPKVYLAPEIMQMIKDGGFKFRTPKGDIFTYKLLEDGYVSSSAVGYTYSTKAKVESYSPDAKSICFTPEDKSLPAACMQVIKKGEVTLVIHTFTNPASVRESVLK